MWRYWSIEECVAKMSDHIHNFWTKCYTPWCFLWFVCDLRRVRCHATVPFHVWIWCCWKSMRREAVWLDCTPTSWWVCLQHSWSHARMWGPSSPWNRQRLSWCRLANFFARWSCIFATCIAVFPCGILYSSHLQPYETQLLRGTSLSTAAFAVHIISWWYWLMLSVTGFYEYPTDERLIFCLACLVHSRRSFDWILGSAFLLLDCF